MIAATRTTVRLMVVLSLVVIWNLVGLSSPPLAVAAYTLVTPVPAGGPGLPPPAGVPGKNFSHFMDRDSLGAPDPEQNVAFDGIGGVMDGLDYSGTRPRFPEDQEVDALANHDDALFRDLRADKAHLIFTVGNGTAPVASGKIMTTEPEIIGRAGDISFEVFGAPTKGIWAAGSVDVDAATPPVDLDGLEVWGPEPPGFDEDRYSLMTDAASGVSVWNGTTGAAYISQTTIISAVTSLLGPVPDGLEPLDIDLDALMVQDADGEDNQFGGPGDSIVFSIRQLTDAADPDGFYATGSELFTLDALAAGLSPGFLTHGGHVWDHKYSLVAMKVAGADRQLDINGIEAVSTVPEPGTLLLLLLGAVGVACVRSRRT